VPYHEYPFKRMMDAMRPYYDEMKAEAEKKNAENIPNKKYGVGIAIGGYNVTGGADHSEVAIGLDPDGGVTCYNTWEDQGQGSDVGSLVLTHEAVKALGVPVEKIRLVQGDTAQAPLTGAAGANRSHYMAGSAIIDSANKLIAAMKKPDGTFRTYDEMVAEGLDTKYFGKYEGNVIPGLCRLDPNTGIGDPTPAYTYCLNMAEVEVDTATGKATCIGFVCVDMVGKVGNVAAVDGQAFGGISHSIGFALSENYQDVKKHANIAGAGIPYIKDIPDRLEAIHMPITIEDGPFGSSGASEAFQASGHCAVLNAIYNACGVRIHEIPALPAKIKAGLDAIAAGKEPYAPAKYYLGPELYEELENLQENPVPYDGKDFCVALSPNPKKG
jgi:aldehyde oxidoreductase